MDENLGNNGDKEEEEVKLLCLDTRCCLRSIRFRFNLDSEYERYYSQNLASMVDNIGGSKTSI